MRLHNRITHKDPTTKQPQPQPQPSQRALHQDELHQIVEESLSSSPRISSPTGLGSHSEAPVAVYASSSFPLDKALNTSSYEYGTRPPSTSALIASMQDHHLPQKLYQMAHYSKENDAPEKPREYAGLLYHLKGGEGLNVLDEWDSGHDSINIHAGKCLAPDAKGKNVPYRWPARSAGWEFASSPPSPREVRRWLAQHPHMSPADMRKARSQVLLVLKLYLIETDFSLD